MSRENKKEKMRREVFAERKKKKNQKSTKNRSEKEKENGHLINTSIDGKRRFRKRDGINFDRGFL